MIEGRFLLEEVTRVRCSLRNAEGSYETGEGRRVKAYASHKPPFGAATPSGRLEIIVATPESIAFFDTAPLGTEFAVTIALAPVADTTEPIQL